MSPKRHDSSCCALTLTKRHLESKVIENPNSTRWAMRYSNIRQRLGFGGAYVGMALRVSPNFNEKGKM